MDNIQPILSREDSPPNKLALFSGHDTTLAPLLVSLGPNVWNGEWPPYASMLIIEIHEIIDGATDRSIYKSDFAFRLLFNGKVLTSKVDKCPAEADLCDVQVLLDRVTPFATRDRDCDSTLHHSSQTYRPALQESKVLLSTSGGVALVLVVVMVSALLGSLVTFYFVTRRMPWQKRYDEGIMRLAQSDSGISDHDLQLSDTTDEAVQLT
jgi:ubiquitin-like domain-containing CTD phosphatase 1